MIIPFGFFRAKRGSTPSGDWVDYTSHFVDEVFYDNSLINFLPNTNHFSGAYGPYSSSGWKSQTGFRLDDVKSWPHALKDLRITFNSRGWSHWTVGQGSHAKIRVYSNNNYGVVSTNDKELTFRYINKSDVEVITDTLSIPTTPWMPEQLYILDGDNDETLESYFDGTNGHGLYFEMKLGYHSYWFTWGSHAIDLK